MKVTMQKINIPRPARWIPNTWPIWIQLVERFIRTKIFRQRPYLVGKWIMEDVQPLETLHGLDLEQELSQTLPKR
jgi:hypothetical protein